MSKGGATGRELSARTGAARALSASIERLDLDGPPALTIALPALQDLLRLDCALAYRFRERPGTPGYEFDFLDERGVLIEPHFRKQVAGMPGWKGYYDPAHPEPNQRNRVMIRSWRSLAVAVAPTLEPAGLRGVWQVRALLCKGPSLLAWLGGFRMERPTNDDVRLFTSVVEPMQRRLDIEQRLGDAELWRFGLAAALDALSLPAVVVTTHGQVKHANALGRARLDRWKGFAVDVRDALAGKPSSALQVTNLAGRAMPHCYLLIEHRQRADVAERASRARLEWKLTAREAEVLALLAAGAATKAIADQLGCAMRTVEAHATQVFRKAKVDGRAELIVKVWSS